MSQNDKNRNFCVKYENKILEKWDWNIFAVIVLFWKCAFSYVLIPVWPIWIITVSDNGFPDSKIHGANMGPTWVLVSPCGPHVGPMNPAIWELLLVPRQAITSTNTDSMSIGPNGPNVYNFVLYKMSISIQRNVFQYVIKYRPFVKASMCSLIGPSEISI